MKKRVVVEFLRHLSAASVIALVPLEAIAESLSGQVVAVLDGDTIKLLDTGRQEHRIRLAEIDAPEKAQPFGQASKQSLSALAYGKQATAECPSQDRYGRKVCTVFVAGFDVNAEQVARGMAWVYRQYAPKGSPLFRLEDVARAAGAGLWSDRAPVPPWAWRRGERKSSI